MLLSLCVWSGCSKDKPEDTAVTVQVSPVQKKSLQRIVKAGAILFPLQQAAIVPKISAPVKTFYVKRGAKVRKGQLLATLENRDLAAAAQENKGTFDQAQAAYQTTTAASLPEEIQKARFDAQGAKEVLDAEQKVYESRQDLYKQGALPRKEFDQAAVSLTQARNQYSLAQRHLDSLLAIGKQQELKSAAGQLESAKGKYLGAQAQLSYSEIRSPIDGVVTDRPLYPGEMAAAGAPLITVMDISSVIARSHISQQEAALLKAGAEATITVPGIDTPVVGKVTVVSPALDPNSTTVEVWVQAINKDQLLKPGTSVQLEMTSQVVPDALAIPASAILTSSEGETTVMVAGSDGVAHQRKMTAGFKQGDEQQVLSGLTAGENVVTTGAYGLPDKTKIKVEAPKAKAEEPAAGAETNKDDK